jgi:hypothetical protein
MYRKLVLSIVAIVLLTSCAQSQWFNRIKGDGNLISKTRNVGEYDKISVAGSFDVKLVSGKEGKLDIKIEENLLEYLITEVDNGKLRIKWKKGINISTRKGILITVPFRNIDAVTLTGSGDIFTTDTIKSDDFYTSVSGSGDVKLVIDADKITSKITGSGDITISGTTDYLSTRVTGSGDFHGFSLKAKETEAKVTGSGDITVTTTEKISARVTGSGDIDYKGNPEFQDTKVTGSGDITGR